MSDSAKIEYKLWAYTPSTAGGAIACIVFCILTSLHTFRLVKSRTWFCIPFIVGGLFETIGYGARAAAHTNLDDKTPYIIQSVLILVAPILFAASIYMILGRLILRTNSTGYSIVRANWVTKIFVIGDILCFFVQSGGAGMLVQAKDNDGVKRGENIILAGLVLQILSFGFFVAVAATWHKRLGARPTAKSADLPWTRYIWLLYAASALITIRNFCRVVEYALGRDGYLVTHEWPLYVYDFLMMALTLVVCVAWYDPNITPMKQDIEIGMRG